MNVFSYFEMDNNANALFRNTEKYIVSQKVDTRKSLIKQRPDGLFRQEKY